MSGSNEIGEISYKNSRGVEWTIRDIFSYTTTDASYSSPRFHGSGSLWYLHIYPNGETKCNTVGWISLYLQRVKDSSPPQGANFAFGLKRTDGTVEQLKEDLTWVFDEENGYGFPSLLLRSRLLERRSELAPSDALTVTCCLWVSKENDPSASIDMLSRDFLDIFTYKRGCDATLKVQLEEFHVHKTILAARSPVFAAMFEVDMKEKNTGVVDIADCDPEVFKEFLKYMYSGEAEISSNALELYKIADKYGVKSLQSVSLISIMLHLSVENVCDAIDLAHRLSINALKIKTQKFFNKNFKGIISTTKWETFLKKNCLLVNELLKKMASEM